MCGGGIEESGCESTHVLNASAGILVEVLYIDIGDTCSNVHNNITTGTFLYLLPATRMQATPEGYYTIDLRQDTIDMEEIYTLRTKFVEVTHGGSSGERQMILHRSRALLHYVYVG